MTALALDQTRRDFGRGGLNNLESDQLLSDECVPQWNARTLFLQKFEGVTSC